MKKKVRGPASDTSSISIAIGKNRVKAMYANTRLKNQSMKNIIVRMTASMPNSAANNKLPASRSPPQKRLHQKP